jgi:hypothetical protein
VVLDTGSVEKAGCGIRLDTVLGVLQTLRCFLSLATGVGALGCKHLQGWGGKPVPDRAGPGARPTHTSSSPGQGQQELTLGPGNPMGPSMPGSPCGGGTKSL